MRCGVALPISEIGDVVVVFVTPVFVFLGDEVDLAPEAGLVVDEAARRQRLVAVRALAGQVLPGGIVAIGTTLVGLGVVLRIVLGAAAEQEADHAQLAPPDIDDVARCVLADADWGRLGDLSLAVIADSDCASREAVARQEAHLGQVAEGVVAAIVFQSEQRLGQLALTLLF